jgi:hypothetical protein
MGSLSDEMRILAGHLETAELMYPEQSPGVPAEELGEIYALIREVGVRCHKLRKAKLT